MAQKKKTMSTYQFLKCGDEVAVILSSVEMATFLSRVLQQQGLCRKKIVAKNTRLKKTVRLPIEQGPEA